MRNDHRTRRVTFADYDSPWSLPFFRRKKVAYIKCAICREGSRRGIYNRAAFKRGEDYVFTIRRQIP